MIRNSSKSEINVFLMSFEMVISCYFSVNCKFIRLHHSGCCAGVSLCDKRRVMFAIKSLHLISPWTILKLGHFRHHKFRQLNRLSKYRSNIQVGTIRHFSIRFRLFYAVSRPRGILHGSPYGSPSIAGGDLHDRLSAAAASLSRLQQLALEALPFLYAENGLGRLWSETFGAVAQIYGVGMGRCCPISKLHLSNIILKKVLAFEWVLPRKTTTIYFHLLHLWQ